MVVYIKEPLNGEKDESKTNIEEEIDRETWNQVQDEEEEPPRLKDVEEVIRKFKNNKSPGNDQMSWGNFKYEGLEMDRCLQEILKN